MVVLWERFTFCCFDSLRSRYVLWVPFGSRLIASVNPLVSPRRNEPLGPESRLVSTFLLSPTVCESPTDTRATERVRGFFRFPRRTGTTPWIMSQSVLVRSVRRKKDKVWVLLWSDFTTFSSFISSINESKLETPTLHR